MWLVSIILFIIFIYFLDYFLIDKRKLELSKQFNGPKRFPLIGTLHTYLRVDTYSFLQRLEETMELYARDGFKIQKSWTGTGLELLTDDYKLIEKMLTNQKFMAKSSQYNFMRDAVGDGLLFSSGQKWFSRRKILTPTFHFKILEQFFEVFMKHSEILIEKIRKEPEGKAFDIFPVVVTSVLTAICETAMGYEMKDEDRNYVDAVKNVEHIVSTRFMTPWQKSQFLFNLSSSKRLQDKCAKIMRDFTTKLIEERRKILIDKIDENLENLDDDSFGLKRKMCMLDVLLQSRIDGRPLNNEDIQEEVDNFTFAGHDTTSNVTSFTLYMISKYPEVQEKINAEISDVLGDNELTFKHLNDFKYLEMVIKETMRHYPPVPVISRRLFEEVDFGDFIAPADTNYNIILYTLFRDPNLFEKPREFIPERFLTETPTFAFIPFSASHRNCIGQKFAMTMMKTNIINILRNFTLVPAGIKPVIKMNITTKCDALFIGFKSQN